jgi:hypothetical protein
MSTAILMTFLMPKYRILDHESCMVSWSNFPVSPLITESHAKFVPAPLLELIILFPLTRGPGGDHVLGRLCALFAQFPAMLDLPSALNTAVFIEDLVVGLDKRRA